MRRNEMNATPEDISEEQYSPHYNIQKALAPPIPEQMPHMPNNLLKQYADKIKAQAKLLSEEEKYITLCEQRVLELCPTHIMPIEQKHLGMKPPKQEDTNQIAELKKSLALKDQSLHFSSVKIEKLNAQITSLTAQSQQIALLMSEKAQLEKSLRAETLSNEEQRNYIEILKQTLEAKIGTAQFSEGVAQLQKNTQEDKEIVQNSIADSKMEDMQKEIVNCRNEIQSKNEELELTKELLNESEKDKNALLDYAKEMKESLQKYENMQPQNESTMNKESNIKETVEEAEHIKILEEQIKESVNLISSLNARVIEAESNNKMLTSSKSKVESSLKNKEEELNQKAAKYEESINKFKLEITQAYIKEEQELNAKIATLTAENQNLIQEKEQTAKNICMASSTHAELETLKQANATYEKQHQEHLNKISEMNGKLEQNIAQIKPLREQIAAQQKEKELMNYQLIDMESKLKAETQQNEDKQKITEDKNTQVKELSKLIERLKEEREKEISEIHAQLQTNNAQILNLTTENRNLKTENSNIQTNITQQLANQNNQNISTLKAKENEMKHIKEELTTISIECKEHIDSISALKSENVSYQNQIKALNENINNLVSTHYLSKSDWEASINKIKSKLQESENTLKETLQMHNKEKNTSMAELTELYSKVEGSMEQIRKLQYDVTIHQQRNTEVFEELGSTKQELEKQLKENSQLKRKVNAGKKETDERLMISQKMEFTKSFQVLKDKENSIENKLQMQNQELLKQLTQTTQKIDEISKPQQQECNQCKEQLSIVSNAITNLIHFASKLNSNSDFSLNMKKHLSTHFKEFLVSLKNTNTENANTSANISTLVNIVKLFINEIEQYTIVLIQAKVENSCLHKKVAKYRRILTNNENCICKSIAQGNTSQAKKSNAKTYIDSMPKLKRDTLQTLQLESDIEPIEQIDDLNN